MSLTSDDIKKRADAVEDFDPALAHELREYAEWLDSEPEQVEADRQTLTDAACYPEVGRDWHTNKVLWTQYQD